MRDRPLRAAALGATAALALLGATSATAIASPQTVGFDFVHGYSASYGDGAPTVTGGVNNTPQSGFDLAFPAAAGRPVVSLPAGSKIQLPSNLPNTGAWSVQLTFAIDSVATSGADVAVLDLGGGKGIYLKDGDLSWNDAAAPSPRISLGAPALTDGDWVSVVLTASSDRHTLNAFVQNFSAANDPSYTTPAIDYGTASVSQPSSATFLPDSTLSGSIARFRAFDTEVASPLTTLHAIDTTAPQVWVSVAGDDSNDVWAGPDSLYPSIEASDDGTAPLQVQWSADNSPFANLGATALTDGDIEDLQTSAFFSVPTDSYADGATFPLAVKATDMADNVITVTKTVHIDKTPPQGLTIDTPATTTSDRSASPTGALPLGPRDLPNVWASLYRGAAVPDDSVCADWHDTTCGGRYVGYWTDDRQDGNVAGGRYSFNGPLMNYVNWTDDASTPVGPLADGTYTLRVGAYDRVGNQTFVDRTFTVGTPAATPPPAPAPAPAPAPHPPTARDLAHNFLTNALTWFGKETIRSFVKDGVTVPCTVTMPGICEIQVFTAAAPKKIQLSAHAAKAAKTQKGLIASGKKTLAGRATTAIKVKLTKKGKASLKRRHKATKLVVRAIFAPKGGKPIATDKKITLKK